MTNPTTAASADAGTAAPAGPAPTHEEHASRLHSLFSGIEKIAHGLTNPAVLDLLPPKYRAWAEAIGAVDSIVESIAQPDQAPSA